VKDSGDITAADRKHIQAMRRSSENLFESLRREHPRIVRTLINKAGK
jgi:hypothetical protein